MNKGVFFIPIYKQNKPYYEIIDEVIQSTINCEKNGMAEAFFGEHLTDRHEKISSSLMMIASLAKLTKKIKLGSLTTNLNYYNPALVAGLISTVDNMTKGRLILGIGSGTNATDIEALGLSEKNNYSIMIETQEIIKKILNSTDAVDIKSENFIISTKKNANKELGLGFFNNLYKKRKDLEIVMPALNKNSRNVKLCAQKGWSIVISNFCSESIIENHVKNYIENSPLEKKSALKKIKICRYIFVAETLKEAENLAFKEESPYMQAIQTLFKKLKTFNKHHCFGEGVNDHKVAAKNILLYGTPDTISKKMNEFKNKFGDFSSLINVSVPKANNKYYDNSIELFAKHVRI